MYVPHRTCRACGYGRSSVPTGTKASDSFAKLVSVFNLGLQPLANDFCAPNEERAGYAPLEVLLCPRCQLAQLSVVVRPEILYSRYAYQSSPSQTMRRHFESLHQALRSISKRPFESVVEIGSNDGLFLNWFRDTGAKQVFGIEPAANLAEVARAKDIFTINSMFNLEAVEQVRRAVPEPDLIIARHVFCHIDDWVTFMADLGSCMAKNTIAAIEIPYVPDILATGSFDQIYHEHLSYLNLNSVSWLLQGTPLQLADALRFPVHGGVIVLIIKRQDSDIPTDPATVQATLNEKTGAAEWIKFADNAANQIAALRSMVHGLVASGKRVCGLGASAKCTVWINACRFDKGDISYVMDFTRWKVYKQVPGTEIPIVQEGAHIMDAADYCVLWAWNYELEILQREKQYLDLGGKFIVPIPQPRIVGSDCACKTECASPNVTA